MNINQKAVNALRILSADQVQKANSGHPGLPLGAAPIAYSLWANNMNHNPKTGIGLFYQQDMDLHYYTLYFICLGMD